MTFNNTAWSTWNVSVEHGTKNNNPYTLIPEVLSGLVYCQFLCRPPRETHDHVKYKDFITMVGLQGLQNQLRLYQWISVQRCQNVGTNKCKPQRMFTSGCK